MFMVYTWLDVVVSNFK